MKKLKFHWGWGIGIAYTAFALATLGFVAFALTQRIDLVQSDYYEESLQYNTTQRARSNAKALQSEVSVSYNHESGIIVYIPQKHAAAASGSVLLYRPDQPNADILMKLSVDNNGAMKINPSQLRMGVWRVTVKWMVDDKHYEYQSTLYIG